MRRAMTMLEVLLALGLLSAVAGLLLAWMSAATGAAAISGSAASWMTSADRALQNIHDDIAGFERAGDERRRESPRVTASRDELSVRTRDAGSQMIIRYALDSGNNTLQRSGQPLIDEVASFTCEIDEEHRTLRITITSAAHGRPLSRSYRLP